MTLDAAKQAVTSGIPFGDVYPFVQNGEEFKSWFVTTPGLPNLTARARPTNGENTGEECQTCGGANLVWAGKCRLCLECGSTSGGCS